MIFQIFFLTITISNRELTADEIQKEQQYNAHIEKQQNYQANYQQYSRII